MADLERALAVLLANKRHHVMVHSRVIDAFPLRKPPTRLKR